MQRIAVLTSGGDAPGMNAAIRAAVRTGLDRGWEVFGVHHGYAGLIAGDLVPLGARSVSNIMQQGGTVLGSARCPEFMAEAGRRQALQALQAHWIGCMDPPPGERAFTPASRPTRLRSRLHGRGR